MAHRGSEAICLAAQKHPDGKRGIEILHDPEVNKSTAFQVHESTRSRLLVTAIRLADKRVAFSPEHTPG